MCVRNQRTQREVRKARALRRAPTQAIPGAALSPFFLERYLLVPFSERCFSNVISGKFLRRSLRQVGGMWNGMMELVLRFSSHGACGNHRNLPRNCVVQNLGKADTKDKLTRLPVSVQISCGSKREITPFDRNKNTNFLRTEELKSPVDFHL